MYDEHAPFSKQVVPSDVHVDNYEEHAEWFVPVKSAHD